MRWLFVLILTARLAHAEESEVFALAGLGTSMSNETTGWELRAIARMENEHPDDEPHRIGGAIVGLDVWGAGDRWGLSFPTGGYVGAEVGSVRTTIGGGLGMYAVEQRDGDDKGAFGIAPFATATVEKLAGNLIIVLEGTVARQIVAGDTDHNIYTVMLMGGRRFGR
jgi:hypothetical protein